MATHSSVLAWRIPGTGEPGGLPSMRSHRGGGVWLEKENVPSRFKLKFISSYIKCKPYQCSNKKARLSEQIITNLNCMPLERYTLNRMIWKGQQ